MARGEGRRRAAAWTGGVRRRGVEETRGRWRGATVASAAARVGEERGGELVDGKFWQPDGVLLTPRDFRSRGETPPATI